MWINLIAGSEEKMASVTIPSHCPSCSAVFESRAYSFSGNIKGLYLSDNTETCPQCGGTAFLADGVFDIADDVISIILAPNLTREMLKKLGSAVQNAYKDTSKLSELIELAESIDPAIAKTIKKIASNKRLLLVGLFLLAMAIKSCSANVSLDVNRLIDQLKAQPPQKVSIETYRI
jgi:hypothetical protein